MKQATIIALLMLVLAAVGFAVFMATRKQQPAATSGDTAQLVVWYPWMRAPFLGSWYGYNNGGHHGHPHHDDDEDETPPPTPPAT